MGIFGLEDSLGGLKLTLVRIAAALEGIDCTLTAILNKIEEHDAEKR